VNERLLERFVALVRRELGATDVQVVPADAPEPGDHVVSGRLHDGRRVDITVEGDRASLLRRLQMLVSAFESALVVSNEPEELRRRPPSISLQEELRALATRAGALDAIVIDAHSPVVWASAQGWAMRPAVDEQVRQAIELQQQSRRDLIDALRAEMDEDEQGIANDAGEAPQGARIEPHHLSRRAIDDVRGLSALPSLRRGAHLAHMVRDDGFGYLARSFAGIYVVVVVFDHLFDELRAERAVRESLARVERLVLALPPLDPGPPAPQAGVVSLRPRRRR
jgi:hypothetical protein